jgi:hypothetical protein
MFHRIKKYNQKVASRTTSSSALSNRKFYNVRMFCDSLSYMVWFLNLKRDVTSVSEALKI